MDLSGLIFVALAVAWAVYLIPKALRHHEDVARSRTVDQFSDHLRVLARREPVSAKAARLVVSRTRTEGGRQTTGGAAVVESDAPAPIEAAAAPAAPAPAPPSSTRPAPRSAARRRRRVLGAIVLVLVATVVVALVGRIPTVWIAAPAALLVAWLVACRVMVKGERAVRRPADTPRADAATVEDSLDADAPAPAAGADPEVAAAVDQASAPDAPDAPDAPVAPGVPAVPAGLWDPLPMTLPTYVSKSKATKRTVRTIDLDDSDVWTSGRTEVDAALAREADADRAPVAPEEPGDGRRAVGS